MDSKVTQQSAGQSIARNPFADAPRRQVKLATIYTAEDIVTGVILDPAELDRLSNWMCTWDIFGFHDDEGAVVGKNRSELNRAGGACDDCRRRSGLILAECPYIDMNRAPELDVLEIR